MGASNRNIITYDLETTGLDCILNQAEVIEICAKATNISNLSDHPSGVFHVLVRPENPNKIEPGALKAIGKDLWANAQENGLEPKVAWKKLAEWCESVNDSGKIITRPIMISHNWNGFDRKFTYNAMIKHNLFKVDRGGYSPPWGFEFDSLSFAFNLFESKMDRFNLDVVLEQLNLKRKGDTHSALEDVELLTEFVRRYFKLMRQVNKNMKIE